MTVLLTVTGNPFSCPCFIPFSGLKKLYFTHRRLPGITARFHVPVIPRSRLQIQLHRIEKTARLIILSRIKQQMLHRCIRCYTDSRIALFFSFRVFHFPGKDRSLHSEPHWIFQMIHLCVINFHFNILLHLIFENSPIFSHFIMIPFEKKGSVLQEKTSLFAPFPAHQTSPRIARKYGTFSLFRATPKLIRACAFLSSPPQCDPARRAFYFTGKFNEVSCKVKKCRIL